MAHLLDTCARKGKLPFERHFHICTKMQDLSLYEQGLKDKLVIVREHAKSIARLFDSTVHHSTKTEQLYSIYEVSEVHPQGSGPMHESFW